MSFSIREAAPEDGAEIAALHVAVWRDAYRDMAPKAAFDALDEAKRAPAWRGYIAAPPPSAVFAASECGRIIGVIAALSDGDGRAEVKHLCVHPGQQGRGVGRALMTFAAHNLIADGVREIWLGVVKGNSGARRFYRSLGGVEDGSYLDPGPLWRSWNIQVIWSDLSKLVSAG